MKLIYNNYIPFKGFSALNFLGIWLFVRRIEINGRWHDIPPSVVMLNHENIHSEQYKEMGYIGFLVWYLIEWIVRVIIEFVLWLIRHKSRVGFRDVLRAAYKNLSLEQEAYIFESYIGYLGLGIRNRYMWLRYLFARSYKA